jgi:hypothetical protein
MGLISDSKEYWHKYGWHILIILILITFLVLFLINYFSENNDAGTNLTWTDIYEHILWALFKPINNPRASRPPTQRYSQQASNCSSKGEHMCKSFCEFYFQKPFNKTRPDFLKNPVTGENLELDLYNEELKLAIEYNGAQHYHYNSFMHKNSRDKFQNQQYRDLIKKDLCGKADITLVVVPYTIPHDKIGEFLLEEFKRLGHNPSDNVFREKNFSL